MLVASEDIGLKLCNILGIESKSVRKVTIELETDNLAIVTVQRCLTSQEADLMLAEFEQFKLTKKDGEQ